MTDINNVIAQLDEAIHPVNDEFEQAISEEIPSLANPQESHIPEELVHTFERFLQELDETEPPTTVDTEVSTLPEFDNSISNVQAVEELDVETSGEVQADPDMEEMLIPFNRASLQVEETTSRFSGAVWYNKTTKAKVLLAGVGGIGSYVAFLLSRLNVHRIIMYDSDKVEAGNLSGQLYKMGDVGMYKVQATTYMMNQYGNYYKASAITRNFTENDPYEKIMMCGFDNMAARKMYYHKWKEGLTGYHNEEHLFIDGRLAAEEFQVFAIMGDDTRAMRLYESKWLFDDEEAEETLCSYKQTSFMANMIGSVMVNIFVNFLANQCDPIFPRDVPFLTQYNASTMMFKVDM